MLPESKQVKDTELLDVYSAMQSMLILQTGAMHPDLREEEEEKAAWTLRKHRALFNKLFLLQQQGLPANYEPGMAPIYRLPVELLAHIFTLLADQPYHESRPYASPIALSQVCRSWRTIAEQTPQLWSSMPLARGLDWTQRALQYSQNTSLDVRISSFGIKNPEKYKQAVQLTLEQLPRIRSLDVTLDEIVDGVLSEVPTLLRSRPASALKELEYRISGYRRDNSGDLNGDLFTGACPEQLRSANIRDITVRPDCPIFRSQLTTLCLNSCSVWATVDDMMRTLKGLPMLENLTWIMHEEVALQMDERDRVETEPRSVRLPHLKTLELQDEIAIPLSIFTCLDIPPSTSILIHGLLETVIWQETMDVALVRLDETLGAHLRVTIGEDSFTTLTLTEFAGSNESGYSAVFEEPSLSSSPKKFMLGFCFLSDRVDEYNELLSRTLSWGSGYRAIRQVVMCYDLEFLRHAVSWKLLLERLPSVEELHVREGAGIALLSTIAEHSGCAPALRKIVIRDAHGLADVDIDKVVSSLDARSAAGLPRVSLSLVKCDMTEDQIEVLEQSVGIDEVFCYPRIDKQMLDMAKRFGLKELPAVLSRGAISLPS